MSLKNLSLKPQNINDKNWYYEEPEGLELIHRVSHEGKYLQTDNIIIPWNMIKKSLERKEKK